MGKGQVSVGDDTPTGEPENGPRGPYITDKDDGTRKPGRTGDNSPGNKAPGKRPLPTCYRDRDHKRKRTRQRPIRQLGQLRRGKKRLSSLAFI